MKNNYRNVEVLFHFINKQIKIMNFHEQFYILHRGEINKGNEISHSQSKFKTSLDMSI